MQSTMAEQILTFNYTTTLCLIVFSITTRTPEQGAATPFWLVTENPDKISGRFWSENHELRDW
jgi:hypothetical protein